MWAVAGLVAPLALCVVPLLFCAVFGRGRVVRNANRQLDRLFGLFHALIECFRRPGGPR